MTTKLLTLLLAIIFLASCSSSRYGYMPKVKKGNSTTQAQKTYKKKEIAPIVAVASKTIETASPASQEIIVVNIHQPATKQIIKNKITHRQTATTANAEELILIPTTALKYKEITKDNAQNEERSRSWLWYIVVGIVFLLIAALLGGLVGSILYIVGVVAIIFGLLALLGIV